MSFPVYNQGPFKTVAPLFNKASPRRLSSATPVAILSIVLMFFTKGKTEGKM